MTQTAVVSRVRVWTMLGALAAGPSAMAQPLPESPDAMMQRGIELRRRGQDEDAFALFEAAWEATHGARARAQMGLAAQALGRWTRADRYLREALADTADAWVSERRAVLQRSLDEIDAHLGLLELRCNVEGAEVRVDGAVVGVTPLREPLRLPAGTVAVQLRADGYVEAVRQAVVTLGETTREQVDLTAVTPVATRVAATVQAPRAVSPPVRPPPHPPSAPGSLRRTLAWTSAGVAVAGVALGAIALGLRNASAEAFNARNRNADPRDDCAMGSSSAACQEAESDVATQEALAAVGFAVGGAAAVGAAVLFLTEPSRGEQRGVALRGCGVAPTRVGVGASCEVTF